MVNSFDHKTLFEIFETKDDGFILFLFLDAFRNISKWDNFWIFSIVFILLVYKVRLFEIDHEVAQALFLRGAVSLSKVTIQLKVYELSLELSVPMVLPNVLEHWTNSILFYRLTYQFIF